MRLNGLDASSQRDDSGVATILVVFVTTLLLAVMAIAIDVGRAVAVTRSAQNSADAVTLAMAKDCVLRDGVKPDADYIDYIRTTSAIGNGQSAKRTAGSCSEGFVTATADENMDYSFAKVIGMTDTDLDRPATARWGQLSSGIIFPFTFSACAFPDSFTSGDATTEGKQLMLYGQVNRESCARDGNTTGQSDNSKGFVQDGCVRTSIDGTLHDANGNSFIGTDCDFSNLNEYVGKDVLLPVWGSATGGGGGSDYTITNLVGFHVEGWSANGNQMGGAITKKRCQVEPEDSQDGNVFKGDPTTLGDDTKPCLYGYVTSFVSTSGGTTGASCTTGALQSACYVYLDS